MFTEPYRRDYAKYMIVFCFDVLFSVISLMPYLLINNFIAMNNTSNNFNIVHAIVGQLRPLENSISDSQVPRFNAV